MRYALIQIVACTPLVGLTAWSFVEALFFAPGDAPPAQGDASGVQKLAEATQQRVGRDLPLVHDLSRYEPFDLRPHQLAHTTASELHPLVEKWQPTEQARTLVRKFAALQLSSGTDGDGDGEARRERVADTLKKLRQFDSAERAGFAGSITGAESFFALLEARIERLEQRVAKMQVQEQAAVALGKAADDLSEGRYEACLETLATEPLASIQDAAGKQQIQLLRKRALFRLEADAVLARESVGPADRDLLRSVEGVLRRYPDPPTAAESDEHDRLERRRDRLRVDVAIADLDRPTDLDTLLAQAALIVGNENVEQAAKDRARAHVARWLRATGFPKMEPPDFLLGKQEAVTKNGQRKIGVFLLPKAAESYRFWYDKRNRAERPRGDEQIAVDGFEEPPAMPRYVAWAEEYNHRSEMLIREGGTKEDWQAFLERCDEMDRELDRYRERWGVDDEPDKSCRHWSFRDHAATARKLLARWGEFERVLGQPAE